MAVPDPRYSCFLETKEEHAFHDGWLVEFTDSDVVSLICPRPLMIQTGKLDRIAHQFAELKQEALLANPLLDFDRLLLVKRGAGNLGLPANWQGNCSTASTGYDNEIAVLSPVRPGGTLQALYFIVQYFFNIRRKNTFIYHFHY